MVLRLMVKRWECIWFTTQLNCIMSYVWFCNVFCAFDPRAKSEFNLMESNHSLAQENHHSPATRPKSMAVGESSWENPLARAMYAYLSSGENQLSFLEGDIIALMGEWLLLL